MKINIQTKYLHIYMDDNDYEFVLSAFGKEIRLIHTEGVKLKTNNTEFCSLCSIHVHYSNGDFFVFSKAKKPVFVCKYCQKHIKTTGRYL